MTRKKKPTPRPEPPAPSQRPVVEQTERGVRCGWCGFPHSQGCPLCYEARKHYEKSRTRKP
jgi:rubrerythrin